MWGEQVGVWDHSLRDEGCSGPGVGGGVKTEVQSHNSFKS